MNHTVYIGMYIHRAAEDTIRSLSSSYAIVLVSGPRQTGKTTLLQYLADEEEKRTGKRRTYVTLDNPRLRQIARNNPEYFLQVYPPPVLIDEVQYAPELFPYLKMYVDTHHQVPGAIWLTGSQTFVMMKQVTESLAGRIALVTLLGLSQSEIEGIVSEPFSLDAGRLRKRETIVPGRSVGDIYSRIYKGGMPALYSDLKKNAETYYAGYTDSYLSRDVSELSQVGDKDAFYRFLVATAARTGRMLVYADLAKDADISPQMAKRWLSVLEASHIVVLVRPYYSNIIKRIVKAPLLHFLDTGLCSYLLGWNSPDVLERGAMAGNMLETFVFTEIYKSYLNAGRIPPVFYYRDDDKREIDLMILENGVLTPIEIKKKELPDTRSLRHISYLRKQLASSREITVGAGALICFCDVVQPIDENTWAIPVRLL